MHPREEKAEKEQLISRGEKSKVPQQETRASGNIQDDSVLFNDVLPVILFVLVY